MGKLAVVFPGQGSQYVGMGKDFYERYDLAKETFELADQSLGFSLSNIIFHGPEEELKLTYNTQPAILVTGIAIWKVLTEKINMVPDYTAGHSLGEYTALVAANSIPFKDAIQMVRKRGEYMEAAVPNGEGTMAAIMGINRLDLEEICSEVSEKGDSVQLANINAPNQIVISGAKRGVELASELAKEKGARRAIPLPVSGPFHSRLMKPAKESLEAFIEDKTIMDASFPVVMNVNAKAEKESLRIVENLIEQVVSPVLWTDTIQEMISNGVDQIVEIGPGKVLASLIKKIDKSIKTYTVDDYDSFMLFLDEFLSEGGRKNE